MQDKETKTPSPLMVEDTDARVIAGKLTEAQRKMILAGSAKRAKRWRTICRHAKVSTRTHLGNMGPFFTHDRPYPWPWRLNPLGLQIRAILQEKQRG